MKRQSNNMIISNCLIMKNRISLCFVALLVLVSLSKTMRAGDVVGKITVGYQGWFACPGDSAPIDAWWHWSENESNPPAPDNMGLKSWPEVSMYTTTFETDFTNLGNGKPAALFSSYTDQTVNIHFKWIHNDGIDCAALQRFNPTGGEGPTRDSMAAKVNRAAIANWVKFYIMYDVSGWINMCTQIKTDWTNKMSAYTSSPAYAYENGKPVVCIWGFGFDDGNHPWVADTCINVISWFKAQGCYVIGGVPTYWRTSTNDSYADFTSVYDSFNMISPWMIGRIGDITDENLFYTNITQADQAYCNAKGIAYQPCILPGDMQAGQRDNGNFMWTQFYNEIKDGCQGIYISMFDEYNENNEILNTADSYLSRPSDYKFLTTSSGGTYISPDYYMRLTGAGGKMLKGLIPLSIVDTVSFQSAPIWYRSSFEPGYDALLTWSNSVDSSSNVSGYTKDTIPICSVQKGGISHLGEASIVYSGTANGGNSTNCYFKVIQSNISIDTSTVLEYWIYPENDNSRYAGIDFHCTDGTTLRNSGAVDQNGYSLNPTAGHGGSIPLNAWSVIKSNVGSKLAGKTIDTILIAYDRPGSTGQFQGYIDDISIIDDTMGAVVIPATGITLSPDSFKGPKLDTIQLFASVIPLNATNVAISWTSSNTSVATVNSYGLVSTVSTGKATIYATTQDKGKTDSSVISVISSVLIPYLGIPLAIPGIIPMVFFDNGGQDIAYYDPAGTNHSDSAFRPSESIGIEPTSGDSLNPVGYDIGYTVVGNWIKYTVHVDSTGYYDAKVRVASVGGSSGAIKVEFDGTTKLSFKVPNTNGWQTWVSLLLNGIQLDSGIHVMELVESYANFNIGEIIFTKDTLTTSINTLSNNSNSEFKIYPNPATLTTTLSYNSISASKTIVNIYDLRGKLIKSINYYSQAGEQNTLLDLTGLKSGVYFINFTTKDFVETKKLIVE